MPASSSACAQSTSARRCGVRSGRVNRWPPISSARGSVALVKFEGERVDLDAYYVTNWSPWLDLYILFRTIRTVLLGEGAGSHLWLAIIWCCAILAVSAAASGLLFRRRTA